VPELDESLVVEVVVDVVEVVGEVDEDRDLVSKQVLDQRTRLGRIVHAGERSTDQPAGIHPKRVVWKCRKVVQRSSSPALMAG
jgi:hypothetical protein